MNKTQRVLIINDQSIWKRNATGITLQSLFMDWPVESFLELYLDQRETLIPEYSKTRSVCAIAAFPLQRLMRGKKGNIISDSFREKTKADGKQSRKIFGVIRRQIINLTDISPMHIPNSIITQVDEYRPEVIYTLGASVSVLKMSVFLCKRYGIKIVIHFMDDWAHYLQDESNCLQSLYKRILKHWLQKANLFSKKNIAISEFMSRAYEKETGILHDCLMNSIEPEQFYCTESNAHNSLDFVYAGGIHLDRWKALKILENSLLKHNQSCGDKKKTQLVVYTKLESVKNIKHQFDERVTLFKDYVPHEMMRTVFQDADVLVHVESNNKKLLGYFRFSISTKIPEYLASNRPVLFFGPSEMGLSLYLRDNKVALVASSSIELDECIELLTRNEGKMPGLCSRALSFVHENYNQKRSQEKLKEILSSCL
jgi:glycosyltransferase involved in cell wall biosynthesis